MNHGYSEIFGFNGDKVSIFIILRSDFDILIDRIDSTVHIYTGLIQIEIDFFVYIMINYGFYFRGRNSFSFLVKVGVF